MPMLQFESKEDLVYALSDIPDQGPFKLGYPYPPEGIGADDAGDEYVPGIVPSSNSQGTEEPSYVPPEEDEEYS